MTRIRFASWVPTVTGRLSFSVIGQTSHPSRAVPVNVGDAETRVLVAYQERYLADALLPFRWARRLRRLDGLMWFVCVAETQEHKKHPQERLTGRIFIFHSKKRWEDAAQSLVHKAQSDLRNFSAQPDPLAAYSRPILDVLVSRLQEAASLSVRFSLRRTGEVLVQYDEAEQLWDGRPRFDANPGRRDPEHEVVSQTFYFLRDLSHTHQHHDPYTDTIVDLYRLPSRVTGKPGRRTPTPRSKWRDSVLFTLYSKIVHFKKAQRLNLYYSSAGVLTYATAFTEICSNKRGTYSGLPFSRGSISRSLEVGISLKTTQATASASLTNYTFSVMIGVATISIAVIGLQQLAAEIDPKPTAHDLYISVAEFIIKTPNVLVFTLITFVIAPLFIRILTRLSPTFAYWRTGLTDTLRRLPLGTSRWKSVPVLFAFGVMSWFSLAYLLARLLMPAT